MNAYRTKPAGLPQCIRGGGMTGSGSVPKVKKMIKVPKTLIFSNTFSKVACSAHAASAKDCRSRSRSFLLYSSRESSGSSGAIKRQVLQ